jgi:hypothetical protein
MPRKKIVYKYKIDKRIRLYGICDYDKQIIKINTRRGDVINTYIHEELHRKHPDWPEGKVIKESKKVESRLSIKQSIALLNELLLKINARQYDK